MRLGRAILMMTLSVWLMACATSSGPAKQKNIKDDPYAEYVWPPPPDEAKIQLVDILSRRADVEAESRFAKSLVGATPGGPYDQLRRPIGVAIDDQGRILVADIELGAMVRFDRKGRVYDVFGTTGSSRLGRPMSVEVAADGHIVVADGGQGKVIEYDSDGAVIKAFGRVGDLVNPTDAVVSPDGSEIFVCDSKGHRIVVFDRETGEKVRSFGERGNAEGYFNYPTSLAFASDGALFVVDQMNARVQILSSDGEFLDRLGDRGTSFGQFVRPKAISINSSGLIHVTDAAFNNVQIFDADLRLLTFVGQAGEGPGEFQIAGDVAARNGFFAVVDQLGKRVQLFRYMDGKSSTAREP